MFTPEFREKLSEKIAGASPEAKDFFVDLMTENLLASPRLSEEAKVDVRIMKATKELRALLDKCMEGFAEPIPPTEEGEKLIQKVYPAKKAYLEWLQLTKAGLEAHLTENPAPEIPKDFLEQQMKILMDS